MRSYLLLSAAVTLIQITGIAMAQSNEIAVIVKTTSVNYWQNVRKGAESAIKKIDGYEMSFQGPATESAIAEQVNMVQNALNRHVAGLILAPSDPNALVPAVKKAYENGIPVVIIDSNLSNDGKNYYQQFISTNNLKAGQLCAKKMISKVGKNGKVAIMSYVAGVGSEIGRVGGFIEYIKKNSDLEIIGPYYSESQMVKAMNQTTDVLTANPDLKGIFGANESTAIGMSRAIIQSGKKGQLVAIGFDGNKDLQGFVRDGTLDAIGVQRSYQMGEKGIETIAKLIKGEKVDSFVDTGVILVTKNNIDTNQVQDVLYD